jgi:hypothetical protein
MAIFCSILTLKKEGAVVIYHGIFIAFAPEACIRKI